MSIRGTRPYATDLDQRINELKAEIAKARGEIASSITGESSIALQNVLSQYESKLAAIAQAYAEIKK